MCGVRVTDFEAGAFAGKAAGTHELTGGVCARVHYSGLIWSMNWDSWELAKNSRTAATTGRALISWPGWTVSISLIAHAVLGVALHAQQTDAELALDQLADEFDAAVGQRVDVVSRFLGIIQADDLGDDGFQVLEAHDAVLSGVRHIQVQALVDLVAADAGEVEALEVVEHVLEQAACVVDRRQVAGAQTAVDFNQGVVLALGRVFFEGGFEVAELALVDMFEGVLDAALGHTEAPAAG